MLPALLTAIVISFFLCFDLLITRTAAATVIDGDASWQVVELSDFPDSFMRFMIAEGLSNDGENFIVNSKDRIFITTPDLQLIIAENNDAIPHGLRNEIGYNHLGDCQYADGLIFFPVEEPSYSQPAIFVYNVTTSSTTTKNQGNNGKGSGSESNVSIDFWTYKSQSMMRHMPWIALDPRSNVLYSSEFSDVTELFAFDATSLEFLFTVPLQQQTALQEVQGGAFYNGSLYLGVNSQDTIFRVDVSTGAVAVDFVQVADALVKREYEFEGLTFLDLTHLNQGIMHNTGNKQLPNQLVHSDYL